MLAKRIVKEMTACLDVCNTKVITMVTTTKLGDYKMKEFFLC